MPCVVLAIVPAIVGIVICMDKGKSAVLVAFLFVHANFSCTSCRFHLQQILQKGSHIDWQELKAFLFFVIHAVYDVWNVYLSRELLSELFY